MIFEKFINFIDKNYHHKRLIKFLKNYKIDLIIDIGSHKGEFIKNIIKYINFQKAYTFEPQKEVFDIHPDPISLFPFKMNGHYTVEGYNLISKIIYKRINDDGLLSY